MSGWVGIIIIFPISCFFFSDDISVKEKPAEKSKEKKVVKPVRKVQKATQLSSPDGRTGYVSQYHVHPQYTTLEWHSI